MNTEPDQTEQRRQFEAKLAIETEKLALERERFDRANQIPWYRSNLPWLGPTLGALVAFFSLLYSNSVERARQIEQRQIENTRLEEENIRQAEARRFQRETQIILQATRSADPEVNTRNLEFFLKADYITETPELRAALNEIGTPTETGEAPVREVPSGPCNVQKASKPTNFKITDGRFSDVLFCTTPNQSNGPLKDGKPRFIIIDYSGSPSLQSTAAAMMNPSLKASSHILIGRDGKVIQFGALSQRLWHAGRSKWKGINGLNSYSVGIELVNFGYLTQQGSNFQSWNGVAVPGRDVQTATHENETSARPWQRFTDDQLKVLDAMVTSIAQEYDIPPDGILGQYQISPGRKHGPGPLLDLDRLRRAARK